MNNRYSKSGYFVGAGVTFLAVGTVFYLLARPPSSALFLLFTSNATASLPHYADLLGPLNNVAPSFFHSLGFALLSMSIVRSMNAQASLCLAWFATDTVIEFLPLIDTTSETGKTVQYLTSGTFDPFDIVAIAFGCLIAFTIGRFLSIRKRV